MELGVRTAIRPASRTHTFTDTYYLLLVFLLPSVLEHLFWVDRIDEAIRLLLFPQFFAPIHPSTRFLEMHLGFSARTDLFNRV